MKIADVARYRPVIGSAISSDGRWAAAVVPRLDRRTGRKGSELLLGDLDSRGPFRRLATEDGLTELYAPTFSPDSRRLAALADEGEGQRGVLFDLVGEPRGRTLRGIPPGARALGWRGGVPSCLGDDADGCRRVWAWPSLSGLPAPVTPAGRHAGDFAWRPDGQRLAWLEIPDAADEDADSAVVHLVEAGASRTLSLLGHPVGWLAWSPDGKWLAYCARRRGVRLSAIRLWVVDPDRWPGDAGAIHCVTRELDGWVSGYDWASDGSGVVVALVQGTEGRLWHVTASGDASPIGARGIYVSGPHTDRSRGRMLLLEQDVALPQRLVLSTEGGSLGVGNRPRQPEAARPQRSGRVILRVNRRIESSLQPGETISWTSDDGARIDGVLIRPASSPAPLLVWLHGGPADHVARTFSPYFQVFASAGYAVLAPNYRGSTGRDEAFLRGTVGALGVTDGSDVLHGIDRLVQMGIADPQRTAAVGWSYGGTLALTLAMRTDLFGALVVGAPVVDWVAFTGAPRFPLMLREYFPTPFWQDRVPWDQASPLTHLERLHTPTLVLQGGQDRMNPPSQARALYRALRARQLETDLMVYPNEGHIPTATDAVEDMLARILRWLGRHVQVE